MRILLLGANGQVGWQLRRSLAPLGEVIALTAASGDPCGDLAQPAGLARTVRTVAPDVVVNAAAYTAVDRAEDDAATAFAINAAACEVLALETQKLGAWLVHYSTDYVYDGSGDRPWVETDATGPMSVYGRSKLAGDRFIETLNPRHLIFRASWVHDSWGQNFIKSILKAAATRERLTVVADQWGAPTRAALIADVTACVLLKIFGSTSADGRAIADPAGTYHLAATGCTHWQAYAALVVERGLVGGLPLRTTPDRVLPIASSEYAVRAARPGNSRLNTEKLRTTFGLSLPPWQDGVHAVVAEIAALSRFARP